MGLHQVPASRIIWVMGGFGAESGGKLLKDPDIRFRIGADVLPAIGVVALPILLPFKLGRGDIRRTARRDKRRRY